MMDTDSYKEILALSRKELIILYQFLKKGINIDPLKLQQLLLRLEKRVYELCTIEEIENIEEYYRRLS